MLIIQDKVIDSKPHPFQTCPITTPIILTDGQP